MRILFGIFILLHGLVHLLYFGHSLRLFELKPGLAWPAGSWAFSKLLGDITTRNLASISLILATAGLIVGSIGIFAGYSWWRLVVVGVAIFSSVVFILLWNGRLQNLDGQGGVGVLINLALLLAILIFRLPQLGF